MSARRKQPAALPLAWYWTIPALCRLYDCHEDQIYYALDAGQLKASVLVPKHRLPLAAQQGPAPHACVVLPDYRSLDWQHSNGEAFAHLAAGEYMAFVVDGEGFTPLPVEITEPIPIPRRDLVITEEAREEMEAVAVSRPSRSNKAEQKATALLIGALARTAYPTDCAHPYRIANKVCTVLEIHGAKLSRETVAQKLKIAFASSPAKDAA